MSTTNNTPAAQTPLMRQYTAAKSQHPDALLFFRLGDFYELFFEDAITASRELQLTLTSRDKTSGIPMCGVPWHAAEGYLQKLLRKGYRVALCEQLEDPRLTKKIVRREVTRVLTPGTAIDPTLDSGANNYLAAIVHQQEKTGIALLDLSTGDFRCSEFSGGNALRLALQEIERIAPSEILLPDALPLAPGVDFSSSDQDLTYIDSVRTKTSVESWVATPDYALPLVNQHFKTLSLDGFGLAGHDAAAIAAGVVLHYVRTTQQGGLDHIDTIRFSERSAHLELDAVSIRNLELVDPLFSGESTQTTLLYTLDNCQTPMGKRLLRSSILRPLIDLETINARLDAVTELHTNLRSRDSLRRALENIFDIERLLARLSLDSAGPRDLLALGKAAAQLPAVHAAITPLHSARFQHLAQNFDSLTDIATQILNTLADDPPIHLADGNAIRDNIDAELDELRGLSSSGRQSIAAIEERERARTGINSLKVRFNNVFGYYIEITKSNLANVPADYERKQTLVNAERFTTPELKQYEVKVLTAQERSLEIERRLFAALRVTVLAAASRIRETARTLAEIDLLANFAHLAAERNYTRPIVEDSLIIEAAAARHPVVEQRMRSEGTESFIANDLYLDADAGPSILLLTGPNMGGKSTYLRQAALLAIMAQIGSWIPAQRLRLGLVDRIYTRIGASDNVARGRSTFMVEMTETAAILNTATPRSLVLLDEMGRGTATYDGLSLAWATVEHLHNTIRARTLFATHYHELTLLSDQLDRLRNLRVTVRENASGIVFLHAVEPGAASKSYGIEVARLAGLPISVIERARGVLRQHEAVEKQTVAPAAQPLQMALYTPLSQRVVDRLQSTQLDSLTPLQALNLLEELQQEIKSTNIDGGEK